MEYYYGWIYNNSIIRESVIKYLCPNILCLNETHLEGNRTVTADGYEFISHHRTIKHQKVPTIHHGVGVLIKGDIYDTFLLLIMPQAHCAESTPE